MMEIIAYIWVGIVSTILLWLFTCVINAQQRANKALAVLTPLQEAIVHLNNALMASVEVNRSFGRRLEILKQHIETCYEFDQELLDMLNEYFVEPEQNEETI